MATATWDQTNFNRAMHEAARFTRRTPALAVNTAAFHVVLFWIDAMEKVPIERMDSELAATLSPGRLKSGGFSKAKKRSRERVSVAVGGAGRSTTVPLAVLIIQARTNLLSKYSFLTNARWHKGHERSPYHGIPRHLGAILMKAAVSRLIKARHRSKAFLASSLLPAADTLRPLIAHGSRGKAPPVDRKTVVRYGAEKGGAIPAVGGQLTATCVIFSNIGLFGMQARGQYEAIWNHGAPAMQRALDAEAYWQMQYVINHEWAEFDRRTRAYR